MTQTFYEVLGVDPDASTSDIEDAYRQRVKETHPDLNDAADADEMTQRVIEARDVLTDEDERARYDELGHAAYVDAESSRNSPDEEQTQSAAARAARDAGWGETDTSEPSESTAAGTNAGRYERRHREQTASERVNAERQRGAGPSASGTGSTTRNGTAGTTATGTSPSGAATGAPGGSVNDERGAVRSSKRREQVYDTGAWSASSEYNVRKDVDTGVHPLRLLLSGTPLSLVAITFFLYPVMLFSAVFPPFPIPVNLVVGLCTLLLIGYLQSQPSVGVIVFGAWSLLVPLGLLVFGLDPTGIVGLIALAGSWFPFGFSLLTFSILRF